MDRSIVICYIALVFVFCPLTARAQDEPQSITAGTEQLPPFIVKIEAEDSVPTFTDADIWERGVAVHFPQSKVTVMPGDKGIETLERECRRLADEGFYICRVVVVRGSASPEGTQQFNEHLSRRRGEVIAQKIIDWGLGATDSARAEDILLTTQAVEDYYGLRRLMEQTSWTYAPRVIKAIDEGGGDMRKTKRLIRELDDNYVWARLNKLFFPELRASRVVIVVSRPPVEKAETVSPDLTDKPAEIEDTIVQVPVEAVEEVPVETVEELPQPEDFRLHVLAVKTNLLYDAFYMPNYGWAPMPNIQVEYYPRRGRYTFCGEFTFPYWHRWAKNKFFQIRDYRAEVRRYFNKTDLSTKEGCARAHTGTYLGVYLNCNKYGIGLSKTKGWQGEGLGGGLSLGYMLSLTRNGRLRLDLAASLGYYRTDFDPYVYGNPINGTEDGDYYYDYTGDAASFMRRNHRRTWIGPTKLGVSLTFDLVRRKVRKGGER